MATVLFGSVPASIRLVGLDSIALGIVRLVLGTVGMAVIIALQRRSTLGEFFALLRREWWALLAMGLMFGLHWLTYFLSIKLGGASIGTLGLSTYGAQLPLLGWALRFRAADAGGARRCGAGARGDVAVLAGVMTGPADRRAFGRTTAWAWRSAC